MKSNNSKNLSCTNISNIPSPLKNLLSPIVILITLGLLYLTINIDIYFPLPVIVKAIIGLIILSISGTILGKLWNQKSEYGLILFKSQMLIKTIDIFANKYKKYLQFMADVALTWGLGLLGSYIVYINTKNIKRTIATSIVGIVLLAVTLFIISPVISQLIPSIIQGIDYTKAYSQTQASINEPIIILTQILFVIGGFMLSFTLTLIYYAGFTLANLISVFTEGGIPLEPTTTAIIPGVSIPFIEGVLALIIVLFVHEVSHGLLARVAKVKLKSVGVVLLGILPVGAFVEPDDKELNTKKTIDRVRVYIAGVGANFITMMLFFIIFLAIQPIIISSSQTVYVYAGNMENYTGQEVISLNNITIESIDFENLPYTSGDTVLIKTTETEFEAIVPESGKVGIMGNGKINDPLVLMLFNTIALILALNYFVAIFNLIPISILDGYYILESVISKNKIKWISYALIASMISMFLPWLFK